jgi:hypothetical protein
VSLKTLSFPKNLIKSIPPRTFSGLRKLEKLFLDEGLKDEMLFEGLNYSVRLEDHAVAFFFNLAELEKFPIHEHVSQSDAPFRWMQN